jgi:hypothetical protein
MPRSVPPKDCTANALAGRQTASRLQMKIDALELGPRCRPAELGQGGAICSSISRTLQKIRLALLLKRGASFGYTGRVAFMNESGKRRLS